MTAPAATAAPPDACAGFTTLEAWGETAPGIVTGDDGCLALSPADVAAIGLAPCDVLPLAPPGPRHLRGLSFTYATWHDLGTRGARTYLFRPRSERWRPLLPPPDLLAYVNAGLPRLCTNRASAYHLDPVRGVHLRPALRRLGMDLLPLASVNSATLLGSGSAPAPDLVAAAAKRLAELRPQVAIRLRYGLLPEAARLVDEVLLVGELGTGRGDVEALREGLAESLPGQHRAQPPVEPDRHVEVGEQPRHRLLDPRRARHVARAP